MQFVRSGIYRGFRIRFGAREVAPGLFEPMAESQSSSLGPEALGTEMDFDRRWLMGLNEAMIQAHETVTHWVDAQKR
ncbi:MAG: hypothetical protein EOO24_08125 [Comamonadaceae bacterium]|nr:MAG: hypothetical protein EOO24_08125 [Comamonadaceae bacterium]